MRIIVVGGGASGIVASIFAKRDNNEVIVLEKNSKCLKKLLITGNGRCNYFNDDFSFEHYYSCCDVLPSIINDSNKKRVLDFFSSIGVVPNVKNGYYYPNSNQAYSVFNSLLKEASLRGVQIKCDVKVLNIVKRDDKFVISTDNEEYVCDKVIISTGGKSYPKTGSDGDGYLFGESFGHKIVPVSPGLVGLVSNGKFFRDLSGVRCDASVSLCCGDVLKNEIGELQFTDYGLSGICIFNLSNVVNCLIRSGKSVFININFFYKFCIDSFSSFCNFFDKVNDCVRGRSICEILEGYLNYKIVNVILKLCDIDNSIFWNMLSGDKKKSLYEMLTSFNISIVGTRDFDCAQVSVGGISLDDIDINSFESRVISGLYFTGEVLDVAGDCGGYNLGFAFLSGMIAGGAVGDCCD